MAVKITFFWYLNKKMKDKAIGRKNVTHTKLKSWSLIIREAFEVSLFSFVHLSMAAYKQ